MSTNNIYTASRIYRFLICMFVLNLASCQSAEELKTEQYFAEGYQLYMTNCANCHQADGNGMANLYPSLAGSAMLKDPSMLACIIRNGTKGIITADGKEFNRPMPANTKLTDLEIAEIVTYVKMKWQKDSVYTSTELVTNALKNCQQR
jgi:mono/diheme cytochrome c family protein